MRVFLSTVVRGAPAVGGGELISLDWTTKRILNRVPVFPTNPDVEDPNSRGNARGGRGIALLPDELFVANYHSLAGFNFDVLSGADYVWDLSMPIGSRVTSLTYKGRPMAASDSFTLALNNYRAGGGGGYAMLAGAPVVFAKDVDIRQLLIDEAQRLSKTGAALDLASYVVKNWRLEPAAAVAAAYAEQHRGSTAPRNGGNTKPSVRDTTTPPGDAR